jgi:CheY-like chemotaxis protein
MSLPPDTEPPLVLIVDDDRMNRKLARDVLQVSGFRTLEAGSAAEGVALAAEHLPDVILMDLRLPDMDGAAAARKLADGPRTATIPIVVLSAVGLGTSESLRAAGFAGWLVKPISVSEFPDQVRSYCTDFG